MKDVSLVIVIYQ